MLFHFLDADRSGTVSKSEWEGRWEDESIQAFLATLHLETFSKGQLFRMLDRDGSGEIQIEEFVEGCQKLKGPAQALDIAQIKDEVRVLGTDISNLLEQIQAATGLSVQAKGIDRPTIVLDKPGTSELALDSIQIMEA